MFKFRDQSSQPTNITVDIFEQFILFHFKYMYTFALHALHNYSS